MRKIRRYGKPLPSKRNVQAHLNFYAQVNEAGKREVIKMTIVLTSQERVFLERLLNFELHKNVKLQNHALAHGDDIFLQDALDAQNILAKLDAE